VTRWGRQTLVIVGLAALLLGAIVARLIVGEALPRLPDGHVNWDVLGNYLQLRRDRVIIGLIVGASLGAGGAVLQALLRNPLSEPYILGISSGAALGVMAAWAGWLAWLGTIATHAAALGGAMATMLIVYLLAQKRGRIDPVGLLLVGVIINALNGAAILFLNYLNPHGLRSDMARWMMGYLDESVSGGMVSTVGAITVACIGISVLLGRAMDVAAFSDAESRSLGLPLARVRLILFATAGILTAGSVMLAGPVGFVGLICPHIVRLLAGPSSTAVVLGSALAGGVIVIGADAAIKFAAVHAQIGLMPLGVLTALIGGPMFLVLLRPHLGRGAE
jgi:iron complex transport system permease protein